MTTAVLPQVAARPATGADERLMRSLFADTRADFFLLDPDVRDALLDMQYRARRRLIVDTAPLAERLVLSVDGEAVGCLVVEHDRDEIRIIDLMVLQACRYRGVATSTILDLTQRARTVSIEISAANERFAALLDRLDFRPTPHGAGRIAYTFAA